VSDHENQFKIMFSKIYQTNRLNLHYPPTEVVLKSLSKLIKVRMKQWILALKWIV